MLNLLSPHVPACEHYVLVGVRDECITVCDKAHADALMYQTRNKCVGKTDSYCFPEDKRERKIQDLLQL